MAYVNVYDGKSNVQTVPIFNNNMHAWVLGVLLCCKIAKYQHIIARVCVFCVHKPPTEEYEEKKSIHYTLPMCVRKLNK